MSKFFKGQTGFWGYKICVLLKMLIRQKMCQNFGFKKISYKKGKFHVKIFLLLNFEIKKAFKLYSKTPDQTKNKLWRKILPKLEGIKCFHWDFLSKMKKKCAKILGLKMCFWAFRTILEQKLFYCFFFWDENFLSIFVYE